MAKTILEVLEAYRDHLKMMGKEAEYASTKTALIRFTIGGWGGPTPSGKKATAEEVAAGLQSLNQLPSEKLEEALAVQNQVFEQLGIPKAKQRGPRCYLTKLVDWATQQGCLSQPQVVSNPNFYRLMNPPGQRRQYTRRLTDRKQSPVHALGSVKGDFFNPTLQIDLETYKEFCIKNLAVRVSTVDQKIQCIRSILGWLHRYKNVPLESLNLQSIIPFVQLNLKVRDFKDDAGQIDMDRYRIAKLIAQDEIKEIAVEVMHLFEDYAAFSNNHPRTQRKCLDAMISVAKYIYRHETSSEEFANYEDISIIQRLRKRCREVERLSKDVPGIIPYEAKSVPWTQAIEVLEKLRLEADITFTLHEKKGQKEPVKYKRSQASISRSLQKFLLLGFMMLIPPDRSRTYQELEVGRTLKRGRLQDSFIPVERMQDPSQALWYIHLKPNDYKTGRTYGEFWGEVPDIQFPDGKTFYEYIDRFLNKERAYLKPQHNCFFVQQNRQPFTSNHMAQLVRLIFMKFTAVPVTPKELRKMYVTHLKEIGATEAELEAAAASMHHSRQMQSQTYDQQKKQAKLQPVVTLNQRILQSALFPNPKT